MSSLFVKEGEGGKEFAGADGERYPYFADPALRQRLDLLHHLIEYADLLLVVKGPYGSGKSALLDQLIGSAKEHWFLCRVNATPLTTRDQFLSQVANQLVPGGSDSGETLETAIVERLNSLQISNRVVVLVIDDAHALAAPVLDLIVKLHEHSGAAGKLLRVILFAESSLDESLQSPALRPLERKITHTLDLPPFAREQSRAFLEHLLASMQSNIPLPLPDETVNDAHEKSKGLPGQLVAFAQHLVQAEPQHHEARKPESISSAYSFASQKLWLGGLVILLVFVALIYQDEINSLFEPDPARLVQADGAGKVELPLPKQPSEERIRVERPKPVVPGKLPLVETGTEASRPDDQDRAPPVEHGSDGPGKEGGVVAESSSEAAGKIESGSVSTVTQPGGPEVPFPKKDPAPVTPVIQPASPQAVSPDPATQATRGQEWLLAQPKERFTLQFFGVRERSALDEFVRDNKLFDKVSVLETQHQGSPWYVLLYGSYADRDTAEKARTQLAKRYRQIKPWPRTFGSVQEQLQKNN